ncbi:hypothetical protein KCP73_07955 [Salmonella enterica subsp. enterica]|nr:hypothetical protein KCP73_07955 [Salmonella enterica subsp. enterica]
MLGRRDADACISFSRRGPWVLRLRSEKPCRTRCECCCAARTCSVGYRHMPMMWWSVLLNARWQHGRVHVFDAMNISAQYEAALSAVRSHGAHARGTLSFYTTSPAHTLRTLAGFNRQLLETGVRCIAIRICPAFSRRWPLLLSW